MSKIALRREDDGMLDDVVVTNVTMFRAEMMDDGHLWMACYLDNGEAIDFAVWTKRRLHFRETGMPSQYEAIP